MAVKFVNELSAESIAALAGDEADQKHLIKFNFAVPIYLTTAFYDVEDNGFSWLSTGLIGDVPELSQTMALSFNSFSIKMAGSVLANQSLALNENYRNKAVEIYQYIPATEEAILETKGFIQNFKAPETKRAGKSVITWNCKSHTARFKNKNGRQLTDAAQQALYPGDKGFEHISQNDAVLDSWGGYQTTSSSGFFSSLVDFAGDAITDVADATGINTAVAAFGGVAGSLIDSLTGDGDRAADLAQEATFNAIPAPVEQKRLNVGYGQCHTVAKDVAFRVIEMGTLTAPKMLVVYVISEGEVGGLTGDQVTIKNKNGADEAYNSSYYSNVCELVAFYPGVDAGAHNTRVEAAADAAILIDPDHPGWDNTHLLRGAAYLIMAYSASEKWSGDPEITVHYDGIQALDVRDGVRRTTSNPALIRYDYQTNEIYGGGVPLTEMNTQTFIDGANHCDLPITNHDGSEGAEAPALINRHEFNGALITDNTIESNLKKIGQNMYGYTPWYGGQYHLVIKKENITPIFHFNEHNTKGVVDPSSTPPGKKLNLIHYTVPDSRNGRKPHALPIPSATYLAEDNGVVSKKAYTNNYEPDKYRGMNIGAMLLRESREDIQLKLESSNAEAIATVMAGKVITYTDASRGWNQVPFWVLKRSSKKGLINIECIKYASSVYAPTTNVEEVRPNDSTLLNPNFVIAPISLVLNPVDYTSADFIVTKALECSFTDGGEYDQGNLSHYRVEYKLSTESDYQVFRELTKTQRNFVIHPVQDGVTYDVRVYAVNFYKLDSVALSGSEAVPVITGTVMTKLDYFGNDGLYAREIFQSLDGYSSTGVVITDGGILITSTNTSTRSYISRFGYYSDANFDSVTGFETTIVVDGFTGATDDAEICIGYTTTAGVGLILQWNVVNSEIDVYLFKKPLIGSIVLSKILSVPNNSALILRVELISSTEASVSITFSGSEYTGGITIGGAVTGSMTFNVYARTPTNIAGATIGMREFIIFQGL